MQSGIIYSPQNQLVMDVIIHKEKGYAPCIEIVESSLNELSTINLGAAYHHAEEAWNNAKLKDTFEHMMFPHTGKTVTCIHASIPVKFIIVKNYNGYTTTLVEETDTRVGEMSIEEFKEWHRTHKAEWVNGTWVYSPRNKTIQDKCEANLFAIANS